MTLVCIKPENVPTNYIYINKHEVSMPTHTRKGVIYFLQNPSHIAIPCTCLHVGMELQTYDTSKTEQQLSCGWDVSEDNGENLTWMQ